MKKVIIFGGHYTYDPGCVFENIIERDWNWRIAKEIVLRLNKHKDIKNIKFVLGINDSLHNKIKWINNQDDILFIIEIHLNCSDNIHAQGIETIYYKNSKNGKIIATNLYKKLMIALWKNKNKNKQRGVKYTEIIGRHLAFLSNTKFPAVITESLFISNPKERNYLQKPQTFEKIVNGHIIGILKSCQILN